MRALAFLIAISALIGADAGLVPGFRPPAVPLAVIDPYTSVWSFSDNLTDSDTVHWSGSAMPLTGLLAVDDDVFRWMGTGNAGMPSGSALNLPALQQLSLEVHPTRTVYSFAHPSLPILLNVTFSTPAFPSDINLGRETIGPLTYITMTPVNNDNKPHFVRAYYDSAAFVAVQDDTEPVQWADFPLVQPYRALRMGSVAQNVLGRTGDGMKIDWGFHYLAAESSWLDLTAASANSSRSAFVQGSPLPAIDATGPRAANNDTVVLALAFDLSQLEPQTSASCSLVFAYDDIASINFFGQKLEPLWHRDFNGSVETFLMAAVAAQEALEANCLEVDYFVESNLEQAGGDNFATIGALAYRQVTGSTKLVWNPAKNESWLFMKEISSDGDVSTVDVIYPAAPFFLFLAPGAIQSLMKPLLAYANNETSIAYNLPWAPHHLGTWPVCDITPSQQEQMPMEETANLLIMAAAGFQLSGDLSVVKQYWPLLQSWADYLNASLPDPGNQLCTDDFEGPSPHNVNLAAKGVVGLAAYAALQSALGQSADQTWAAVATFVDNWLTMAKDGDHFRLQYDLPGTWSLKYNILFQRILQLDHEVFPDAVMQKELAYYATKRNKYGIPLDNRAVFTKGDWQSWVGALGTQQQFDQVVADLFSFLNESPSRVPFSDWYFTDSGKVTGFQARPVVGGIFARFLVN